jgi:Cu(I)/Ag(I) efflux system membrane fusion protein/cobalt-zinc-cadmium efflux system membrane fusion protein
MSQDNKKSFASIAWILAALVAGVLLAQLLPPDLFNLHSDKGATEESAAEDGQLWTCGMHPQVIEEEPGQCPICGMDLTPMREDADGDDMMMEPAHADHAAQWTCPDHEMIVEDEPGTCPIDGQDLVPLGMEGMDTARSMDAGPEVRVAPAMVQKMNVRTERVTRRDLSRPIRTVGYLEYDQQRMVTVTTKYSGWVEKVYVNYVGEKVRRGQPLFEIYSPELVQTEQELLSALSFARELESAPGEAPQRALSMVESARIRLGYWDVSPQEVERLEKTGEVFRTLEVAAPAAGLVMKRMAGLEGMAVQPGMELFHLADLSSLWLSVELFEDQLAWVREGTEAKIDLSYFPGETFTGRVRFLEPELSEKTRTMRAKIEVPNPNGRLRKGMYATVELRPVAERQALAVPTQAVLRTGQRNVVVMALGDGRFAPREVVLGHEAEGFAEMISGLREGDEVVTSAQFLLDSESSLREAIQKMIAARTEPAPEVAAPADPHAGHQH